MIICFSMFAVCVCFCFSLFVGRVVSVRVCRVVLHVETTVGKASLESWVGFFFLIFTFIRECSPGPP
jgi:hypothetical protein